MLSLGFLVIDPLYLILVMGPGILLGLAAQSKVKSAFDKGSQLRSMSGVTGAQAAAQIMRANGVDDVAIEPTQGFLSDHYDPRSKTLRLSPSVYHESSLSALGVAAHEAGHALQDAKGYLPLVLRNALVPLASIGSGLSYVLLFAGLILQITGLMYIGIAFFAATVVFQLVNLPCEFNASSRAREQLRRLNLTSQQEDREVGSVLNAAALTYVAALVTSLLTLLYFLLRSGLLGGRSD